MTVELTGCHIVLEIDCADGGILDGYLLQLSGKVRLGIHILRTDGLVTRLLQCLLVGCAVLLRQRDMVGSVVFPGGSNDVCLCHPLDAFHLVEDILPCLTFRKSLYQQLRPLVDGFQFLLGTDEHLLFQGLQLLVAEVAVHDLLYLFQGTSFGGLHLP